MKSKVDMKNDRICVATDEDLRVLQVAYKMWRLGGMLRSKRRRNKEFTYGSQWGDIVIDERGNKVTEGERFANHGCVPLTNNLIRQMVKTVVGRFRAKQNESDGALKGVYNNCMLRELDSRCLEDFLISGVVVQRVDVEHDIFASNVRVDNVNINKFFMNQLSDCRGWDDEIVGQLHDFSIAELVHKVCRGNRELAEAIRAVYSNNVDGRIEDFCTNIGADSQSGTDFWHSTNGKCRAIEVWTLESREVLIVHNTSNASVEILPYSKELMGKMEKEGIPVRWDVAKVWRCRWFSPMGDLLCSYYSPYGHGSHPFVIKMYPLTDGEVHSLVEDVIGQQKYVNRLITMLDHMMDSSAKGVLLYPVDAMPEGFTWRDIRRIWASADGVLPFSERDCDAKPEQIVGKPNDLGAYDMINLQMKLFEYVSGVNGALQGHHQGGNSSALYKDEVENSDIAIGDLLLTFETFLRLRDNKVKRVLANVEN